MRCYIVSVLNIDLLKFSSLSLLFLCSVFTPPLVNPIYQELSRFYLRFISFFFTLVIVVNNQMLEERIEFGRSPLSLIAIINNFNNNCTNLLYLYPRPRPLLLRGRPPPRPPHHAGLGQGGSGHAGQGGKHCWWWWGQRCWWWWWQERGFWKWRGDGERS